MKERKGVCVGYVCVRKRKRERESDALCPSTVSSDHIQKER